MKILSVVGVVVGLLVGTQALAADCTPNNITLRTQAEITGFQADHGPCDRIAGRLFIQDGADILSLDGLSALTAINGRLRIQNLPSLTSLDGLGSITGAIGRLEIRNNPALQNIDALAGISAGNNNIEVYNNPLLQNLDGLAGLVSIAQHLRLRNLPLVTDLDALSGVTGEVAILEVENNAALANIDGLAGITGASSHLELINNRVLQDIDGLAGLQRVGGNLILRNQFLITDIDALAGVTGPLGRLDVRGNRALRNLDGLWNVTSVSNNLDIRNNTVLDNLRGLSNIQGVTNTLRLTGNRGLADCSGIYSLLDERDDYLPGPGSGSVPDVLGTITLRNNTATCNSIAAIVSGAPLEWDVASGDWLTASNWYAARVPTSADTVFIRNGGSVLESTGPVLALDLFVGDVAGGGDGSVSLDGAGLSAANRLAVAAGEVDRLTMGTRTVTGSLRVTNDSALDTGAGLQLGRLDSFAAAGSNLQGTLESTASGDFSSVDAVTVGGTLELGVLAARTADGANQAASYRAGVTATMSDIASLDVAGELNIGVVAATEEVAGSDTSSYFANGTLALQSVSAAIGSVARIGVIDVAAGAGGGDPVMAAGIQASGDLLLQSAALSSQGIQVGVVANNQVGSARGSLALNPSYINTTSLISGVSGELLFNLEGIVRASAANLGEAGLYAAIDAGAATLAGPVVVDFQFIPAPGSYDFDLVRATTLTVEASSSQDVRNLPDGFVVTSFAVQPGDAGGSVYRLSISSDDLVDPNDAVPGAPVKVPVMGAWSLLALVLAIFAVAARRSYPGG